MGMTKTVNGAEATRVDTYARGRELRRRNSSSPGPSLAKHAQTLRKSLRTCRLLHYAAPDTSPVERLRDLLAARRLERDKTSE